MQLVVAGQFNSFDFLDTYTFDYDLFNLYSAKLMEVMWEDCEPILFAAVGHTKVEISKNLMKILEAYPVENIILMGCCGVTSEKIGAIGDVAIADQVYQHDMMFYSVGYPRTTMPVRGGETSFMEADPWLVDLATKAARSMKQKAHVGTMGSGDQFVASSKIGAYLLKRYETKFIDSEGSAISEIAQNLQYPFVAVKGISNIVSETGGEQCIVNEPMADCHAGHVVMRMIKMM